MTLANTIFIYMTFQVQCRPIEVQEYQRLRGSTSWNQLADEVVARHV